MRSVVILFCLLFAGRVLADGAYYEGYLPFKASVGDDDLSAQVLLAIKGDDVKLTIIPEGEEEDPLVFSVLLARDGKILATEGKEQIGKIKRLGGNHLLLEFAYLQRGTKVGNVSLELLSKEGYGEEESTGMDINFKLVGVFITIETKGLLAADMEKTVRCSWGNTSDADC